ncbi:tRNA guanosine(34) transglycosylase Tgt [Candidatus Kuenenbacteria bacterium]|nr:tRNA guanosine(34) transglycosylase Tgt [Candidatus Kuenenbacteria bacterium]
MFKVLKQSKKSRARLGLLKTPHGDIETPFFMPIATKGSVKALTPEDLKNIGASIILSNTYHLYLQPGLDVLKKFGGLHKFMGWNGPILTDSGGYQVFSLSNKVYPERSEGLRGPYSSLVKINKAGVEFRSFLDGSKHLFTPESVQQIQDAIGSDIKMVLDVCSPHPCAKKQAEIDLKLTHDWAKRALEYHRRTQNTISKDQKNKNLLFGIIQGSTYKDLRLNSAKFLSGLDFDGLAIGGLAVGEDNKTMYQVLDYTIPELPVNKPRYLMGVGKPENIIEAIKRGVDMFDCVIPTREARHGRLYTFKNNKLLGNFYNVINILNSKYKKDTKPLDKSCTCELCQNYSAGYLHHLFKAGEPLALRLATLHNLAFYVKLINQTKNKELV